MPDRNMQQSGGIFQAGHSSTVQIHDGQFIQHNQPQTMHNCHEADDGFKHLQAHVATSAFDSPEHVDAPKCHPNTRQAVLNEIMNWIILAATRIQWVLWLNGAAGAGKSAIGRSIVDLCIQRNIPIVRFFFFRTDSTRNNIKPIVATLVHQLLQIIPDLKPIIIPRIDLDPLIFTKSLKTQFEFLIFAPLRELKRNSSHLYTLVLLFDGVDECNDKDDQADLIRIVADFVRSNSFPAIAFFASRTEAQITTAFRLPEVTDITLRVPLDNHYLPDNDIRLFLIDSFKKIKTTHEFGPFLDDNWPAPAEVEDIVDKSSGQFIYASVVIKFCSMLGLHPEQQLKIVRGLRPRGALTPFAQLDALYRHIFSQVQDLEVTSLMLAFLMLSDAAYLTDCVEFLKLSMADILVALGPLQSVVDYSNGKAIHFLHASLPDFLLDRERSQEYYVNYSTWSTRLSVMAYKFVVSIGYRSYIPFDMYLTEAEATSELRDHVLAYRPDNTVNFTIVRFPRYLSCVERLVRPLTIGLSVAPLTVNQDFGNGTGGTVYQQQLDVAVRYLMKKDAAYLDILGHNHNIMNFMHQISDECGPNLDERRMKTLAATKSTRNIFKAIWNSKDRSTRAREAGIQREDEGTSSVARPTSGLLRLLRK